MDKHGTLTLRTIYKTRKPGGRVDSALPGCIVGAGLCCQPRFRQFSAKAPARRSLSLLIKSCGLLDRPPYRHPAPNPVSKHLVAKARTILKIDVCRKPD